MRGFRIKSYIFFEMLPSFILGLLVFIFILLMFQALRLTEFVLIHGVDISTVMEMMGYLSISFLPTLLPMALLFAVLLSYGRLSADSEVVAMKASGISMLTISFPAALLGLIISIASAQTSYYIAPWGNRQFEVLISRLGNTKAAAAIKEGTFSEGFFDLVIYAGKVNSQNGTMENIFLYDERTSETPLTIIAKSGQIIPDPKFPGHSVLLRLNDGDIHRKAETHTKIKFDSYDIRLSDPIKIEQREKSAQSLSIHEIQEKMNSPEIKEDDLWGFQTEYHKRSAISIACFIFALLGVGLGTVTNRRSARSSGMIVCLLVIITYWVLYVSFEGLARSGKLPPSIAIWLPNVLFGSFTFWSLKKNWN